MLDFFHKKKETKITSSMSLGLTESGKQEAEKFTSKGPKFAILAALSERSPMSIGELSSETQIDLSEMRVWVTRLARAGFVRFIVGLER